MARAAIVGSERVVLADAEVLGRADPSRLGHVTLHLKRHSDPNDAAVKAFVTN